MDAIRKWSSEPDLRMSRDEKDEDYPDALSKITRYLDILDAVRKWSAELNLRMRQVEKDDDSDYSDTSSSVSIVSYVDSTSGVSTYSNWSFFSDYCVDCASSMCSFHEYSLSTPYDSFDERSSATSIHCGSLYSETDSSESSVLWFDDDDYDDDDGYPEVMTPSTDSGCSYGEQTEDENAQDDEDGHEEDEFDEDFRLFFKRVALYMKQRAEKK